MPTTSTHHDDARRPRILTLVQHYLPGYKSGGPIRTIANMVEHLGNDLEFLIVTSDRDALDREPYPSVAIDSWNRVGDAKVFYASPRFRSFRGLTGLIRGISHDVLYLNSFFNPVFTVYPLLARAVALIPRKPVVIAPRGEFSRGALSLKRWKKRTFICAASLSRLYDALLWQASSEHEVEDIKRELQRIARDIRVASDLPPKIGFSAEPRYNAKLGDARLRIAFLSRITPMKNLDFALRAVARAGVPIELGIHGPIRDEAYWHTCLDIMDELPGHIQAHYHGSVLPECVQAVLSSYDLFLLPTKGENFGHVILEALAAGTPTLISDRTPWQRDANGGCVVLPLDDPMSFAAEIEQFARLSLQEKRLRRHAARTLARAFIENDRNRIQNLALFACASSTR